jgi:hypothetical protein
MIDVEDGCVGCDLPCLGSRCPYHYVRHLVCDVCGREVDELYVHKMGGEQMCFDCVMEEYEVIE